MIIDMRFRPPTPSFIKHTSIYASRGSSPTSSVAQHSLELCVREMEEAGVTCGVVMGRRAAGAWGKVPNDEIAQVCKDYPGRFIGFAGLDLGNPDPHECLKELNRGIPDLGFAGVNLEPGIAARPQYADDPSLIPIYARCQELGVPVSLSLSAMIADDLTYCSPIPVQRVAKSFPQLTIVLSHACWPWVDQAIGVAFACPNIYLSLDFYVTMRMPGHMAFVEAANSLLGDRVLFGSAYPAGLHLKDTIKAWRQLPFQAEVIDKVLGGNAARMLRLEVR